MAEIIDFAEILAERRRLRARAPQHKSLSRAIDVLRQSLAVTAQMLAEASAADQQELLERVENLAAMIRYGMGLSATEQDPNSAPDAPRHIGPSTR